MAELDGRIAIITGASAGIGEATARTLSASGARVVLNARREERLDALVKELGGPTKAVSVPGDAADPELIEQMFAAAGDRFGAAPDLVVVNAGRGLGGSVVTSDDSKWEEMVRLNLVGAARLIRAAAIRMTEGFDPKSWHKTPRDIVVLGSTVGRHISPFSSMYGASKFGVNSLAEAARRELGPKGVRVTLVEPGIVVSEFQAGAGYDEAWFSQMAEKFGPLLEPADIAETIRYIVAQPARIHINDVVIRATRQEYP